MPARCRARRALDYNRRHHHGLARFDHARTRPPGRRRSALRRRHSRGLCHRRVQLSPGTCWRGDSAPRRRRDCGALARARKFDAILARGGGTSLGGQACNAALVLDFSKYMNRVLAIDPGARTALVEPGVVQSHLNSALAPHGLFFAPDPSTKDRCTIGGMIGNNSCGAHSAAYGKTVDNVEALEVILYDGTQLSMRGSMDDAQLEAAIARGGRESELYSQIRELRDHC